jgi:hypothetical protein
VQDNGPGIPDALKAPIFGPFADGPDAGPNPGLGLGLSLVAGCARAHGGRVWIEDTPGGGTTVYLVLPEAPQPLRDSVIHKPRAREGEDSLTRMAKVAGVQSASPTLADAVRRTRELKVFGVLLLVTVPILLALSLPASEGPAWLVLALFALITLYSTMGGIRRVILTVLLQFGIPLLAILTIARIELQQLGGVGQPPRQLVGVQCHASQGCP